MSAGSSTELEVLKFVADGFSFHWTKEGSRCQIKTTKRPNALSFQNVSEVDFGHYQCEVKDQAGKVVLTLYRALYKKETGELALAYNLYGYHLMALGDERNETEEPKINVTKSIWSMPSSGQ